MLHQSNVGGLLRKLKHIANAVIWTLAGLFVLVMVLLHVPSCQQFMGRRVASALSDKLGARVSVGRVDLGFLNRLIIDDVVLLDQQGDSMLVASRLAAHVDVLPLLQGQVSVSSVQLFSARADLYRLPDGKMNFQFVVDSLASRDTTAAPKPLDVHVGSLILRRCALKWNHHYRADDISAHLVLERLTDNLVNLKVKKLALHTGTGLRIDDLAFELFADRTHATLDDFVLRMPHTTLRLGTITATYALPSTGRLGAPRLSDGILMPSLQYEGSILPSTIRLSDVSSFVPRLGRFTDDVDLTASFSGTSTSLRVSGVELRSRPSGIELRADGSVKGWNRNMSWVANVTRLALPDGAIAHWVGQWDGHVVLPQEVSRLGAIAFRGFLGGKGDQLTLRGLLSTDAGKARLALGRDGHDYSAHVETEGFDLGRLLADDRLGTVVARLHAKATAKSLSDRDATLSVEGSLKRFDYGGYSFGHLAANMAYVRRTLTGTLTADDPKLQLRLSGNYHVDSGEYDVNARVDRLSPSAVLRLNTSADFTLSGMTLDAAHHGGHTRLQMDAPFARILADGRFSYATLKASMASLIARRLPTLPGLPQVNAIPGNELAFRADIDDAAWMNQLLGIPLTLRQPLHVEGSMDDRTGMVELSAVAPAVVWKDTPLSGISVDVSTDNDTLKAQAGVRWSDDASDGPRYELTATAFNNRLHALLGYDNASATLPLRGTINAETLFFRDVDQTAAAHVTVHPSLVQVGDSTWHVEPSDIVYSQNRLLVDHFAISHGRQHIAVSGKATHSSADSLLVDLNDVDVSYILNLVNFHSVDFAGRASGRAVLSSVLGNPSATARLRVADFRFEEGEMGTLHADVEYNKVTKAIELKAVADDGPGVTTHIDGYVAPADDDIRLAIRADGTRLDFLKGFCGSFLDDIRAHCYGEVDLIGPLSKPNLTGNVRAKGSVRVSPLNTVYSFDNLRVEARPDEITFLGDTLYDRDRHIGILSGVLHHRALTRLTYDLNVRAQNLLGFDTHEFGDNTFYGTIYATGNCAIRGRSGEVSLDIDATPESGSQIVYNAASPDAVSDRQFIHWHDVTPDSVASVASTASDSLSATAPNIPSDLRINFLINANPNLTLKVVMDNTTGDYIALNGDGAIRASYFNKGAFDMFGNFVVDHGTYGITIQNIIKRQFLFQPGGTITFGGDPYNAALHLAAKYSLAAVSLADLNIGRSFSTNNIRVDCLMNITGTPQDPKVDFSLDMPTVNSDAKQMVYSLINSEEEMNQQVLYLLAVGRFRSQSGNNANENPEGQSQTTLAMQSLLSGTISQQLNNMLSSTLNTDNWNFGANISTGNEGWTNAEYEGILNGRLLNNRLLLNGQFGYRDNANTDNTSFIGDFDIRYLIFPNGNFAIHVYNQANDRYFTRNSLNTQGLGIVLKKDFNGWRDLLGGGKKKRKAKNASSQKSRKK